MTDFPGLIGALSGADVEYLTVGGLAATIHGSSRLTQIDVVYSRSAGRPKDLEVIAELEALREGAERG